MPKLDWSLNNVVNVAVLLFLGYVVLSPSGLLSGLLEERRAERAQRERIANLWSELDASGEAERLDLVVFNDYQCPFCRKMHSVLQDLEDMHGVRVASLHFPLDRIHPKAAPAALAAICAEEQGSSRAMHDRLMTTGDWVEGSDPWMAAATQIGVTDLSRFQSCLTDGSTAERLARDRALGNEVGVVSTPTFVSRHGLLRGAASLDELLDLITR